MRALKQAALLCCGLLAFAIGPVVVAADDAPEAVFRAGTAEWIAAYNAGDVERIIALYAVDATVMPPDAPGAKGHAAIREYMRKDIAASRAAGVTLKDVASDAGTSGELGWHSGRFEVVTADGRSVGTGKYSEVWQKRDGKWRIIRDIWNNDAPPPPPAPPKPAG